MSRESILKCVVDLEVIKKRSDRACVLTLRF